jgi:putative integral membrane protein (TIGR02587 family)
MGRHVGGVPPGAGGFPVLPVRFRGPRCADPLAVGGERPQAQAFAHFSGARRSARVRPKSFGRFGTMAESEASKERVDIAKGLGRAFGGALIFGLPMLMTNEFWQIGAAVERWRLLILMAISLPLLVGVAHRVGFEPTFDWREDLRDALIALGIGLVATALVLLLFKLIEPGTSLDASVGRIAVQAVPAALGALLARSQFGATDDEGEEGRAFDGYAGTLFLMLVGSLFLSLNIAPTEEVIQIAYMMTPWHALVAIVVTVAVMHAFVASHGVSPADEMPLWRVLLRFTLPGYAVALAACLVTLWTFGRVDGIGTGRLVITLVVLGFPAGLGAAAARLLL